MTPLVHIVSAFLYVVAQKSMLIIVLVDHEYFMPRLTVTFDSNINQVANVIDTKDASCVDFLGEHVQFKPDASLDGLNDLIGSWYQSDGATGKGDDLVILGPDRVSHNKAKSKLTSLDKTKSYLPRLFLFGQAPYAGAPKWKGHRFFISKWTNVNPIL
jgi:hypothetical protein